MEIYLLMENQQKGPFTEEQVRQSLREGLLPSDHPAWHDGLPDWVPVSAIVTREVAASAAVPPPFIPSLLSCPPSLVPNVPSASTVAGEASYPWYRSSVFIGLIIGIPWLLGSFLAVILNPFLIAGLVLMATGPIFYTQKGQTQMLPNWYRWLGRGLLLIVIPYYLSILVHAVPSIPPNLAIAAVLRQDRQLGDQYEKLRDNIGVKGDDGLNQLAGLTDELVSKMKMIAIDDCPSDFQLAYTRHINCWSDWAYVVSNHPHLQSGDEAFLEGFARGLAGDPTGGAFEKQAEIDSFLRRGREGHFEIKRSWEEVETVALKYGVHREEYASD